MEKFRLLMEEDNGQNPDGAAPVAAQPQQAEEAQFTQKQLNDLIAKEKSKTQESMLKKLGVESFDDVKSGFQKLKEMEDAKKTDLEKATSRLEELEKSAGTLQSERDEAVNKLAALSNGIDSAKLDRALKLASSYEGETADDKIKAMLEEFPDFKAGEKQQDGPRINMGKSVNNPPLSELEAERQKLRSTFGLK